MIPQSTTNVPAGPINEVSGPTMTCPTQPPASATAFELEPWPQMSWIMPRPPRNTSSPPSAVTAPAAGYRGSPLDQEAGHDQEQRQQPGALPEGRPQDVVDVAVEDARCRAAAGRSG